MSSKQANPVYVQLKRNKEVVYKKEGDVLLIEGMVGQQSLPSVKCSRTLKL
jgi:hypothetical protein